MKRGKGLVIVFLLIFSMNFVLSADANLKMFTLLDSADIQGYFRFETASDSLSGFDKNDFQEVIDYSNYSYLYSEVNSSNLILDSRPSGIDSTLDLIFAVDGAQTGNVIFSTSYTNSEYSIILYDYETDSSRTILVNSTILGSRTDYSFVYPGGNRYFKLDVRYNPVITSTCGDGACNNGETSSTCPEDCGKSQVCVPDPSSWVDTGASECRINEGNTIFKEQESSCPGSTRWISTNNECCQPTVTNGTWSECIDGEQRRSISSRSDICIYATAVETQACSLACIENWNCQWGACTNGFYNPFGCVESNNCLNPINRPNPIPCLPPGPDGGAGGGGGGGGVDCSVNYKCEDWGACEVQNGFDDLRTPGANNDGLRTRKCLDVNSCVKTPYIEQEKCSLKIFIKSNKITICNETYLEIYKENTDYLLARIKDERATKRLLSLQFILGGKGDIDCNKSSWQEFIYGILDKIMSITDLRNIMEGLNL